MARFGLTAHLSRRVASVIWATPPPLPLQTERFSMIDQNNALDRRARRTARRRGLLARKSRWRHGTIDNRGGFQLIDPNRNWIVAGEKFNMAADDVIAYCSEREV